MKIQSINISSDLMGNGLEDINLNKLDNLVLISGKNGSGKTRFLEVITNISIAKTEYLNLKKQKSDLIDSIRFSINNYVKHTEESLAKDPKNQGYAKTLSRQKIQKIMADSEPATTGFFALDPDEWTENCKIINFVPTVLQWTDNRKKSENENDRSIRGAHNPGAAATHQWICSYIRNAAEHYRTAVNPKLNAGDEESRQDSIKEFETLNEMTKSLLGQEFKFNKSGRPTIFGEHILDAKLSSGQKVLLQLAVQIHAQADNMEDVIILLDEPENHLHPQACIDFITKVRSIIPNNQLWISTHSIPILSYFFEDSTLLFVKDGEVKYRGSAPEDVFKSLLGDEERIQKLHDFLGLPSEYAMLKY